MSCFLLAGISFSAVSGAEENAHEMPETAPSYTDQGYGYGAPVYGYDSPVYGYETPTYGYGVPAYGYEAPLPEEAAPVTDDMDGDVVYVPVYYDTNVRTERVKEKAANIPVSWISQYPEYPSGCELTSLTMALNYVGFPISKYEMANNYFVTSEWTPDFRNNYVGDPEDLTGLGCFPPAVVKNANAYLETQHTEMRAYDYTNYSFEGLLNQVALGHPVILWVSTSMLEPFYGIRVEVDGEDLVWIQQEHCLLLTGYDLDRKTVTLADPIEGIVECDMDLCKKRYTQLGFKAVIIKNSTEKVQEDRDIVSWPFNDRFLAADRFVRGCKGFDGVFEAN